MGATEIQSRNIVKKYFEKIALLTPWAIPIKLILGGLLGALGGAGFVGFLSEYATYSFSIYYGFRPPLEGIPYLKATVTLGSFILLITGAVVFFLSLLLVRTIVWSIQAPMEWASKFLHRAAPIVKSPIYNFQNAFVHLARLPPLLILIVAIFVGLATGCLAYFEFKF